MSHKTEDRDWWWWIIRRKMMVYLLDRQCYSQKASVHMSSKMLPFLLSVYPQNVKWLWEKMREEGKGLGSWWLIMRNMTGWLKNSRSSHNFIAQMLSLLSTQYFLYSGLPGFLRLTQISRSVLLFGSFALKPPFPILICSLITIWMC